MEIQELDDFKEHRIKAKDIFSISKISKKTAYAFVRNYHYLADAKFFCIHAYGLYYKSEMGEVCVGVATYSNPQGASALKGWFGLPNSDQTVLELSRLCLLPSLNGTNATSFLLGGSLRLLKKEGIRAVITLADASRHIGSIYQVCNFKYYGLSDKKSDFYTEDGQRDPRIETKNMGGVWVERTRKHRYCYLLDKSLKVLYDEQPHPTDKVEIKPQCCNGTKKVFDKRFERWYSCPICCGYIQRIGEEKKAQVKNNKRLGHLQLTLF